MEKVSVAFTGDIGFDRHMTGMWEDENLLSQGVLDFFHSADHVCINVEGAVIDMVNDGSLGMFVHSMMPEVVKPFGKMHADIWSIGNNHTMDAGEAGVVSTRKIAKEQNAQVFGGGQNIEEASQPVYLDGAGGIGIFGVAYMRECVPATETEPGVFPWDDMERIAKRIQEIKSKCRWCVIAVHGGEEFTALPLPYTRDRYIKFLELGADAVVGHHPHVPENYEVFDNGKMIFYSLGNFIFDTDYQRAHLYTDTGVLLKLIFTEDKLDFEAIGTKIIRGEERIDVGPLPDIFVNIPAEEYSLLAPLGAKSFWAEDKRTMIFLKAERADWTADQWRERCLYYCSEENSIAYSKGAHMDYEVIWSIAEQAENGAWQQSKLEKVKEYILRLL